MHTNNSALVLLRGGGDLATGVALRLHRAGLKIVIAELEQPLAVRRTVSFAEAVYEGKHTVEGVTARLVKPEQLPVALEADEIPVLIDPNADILTFAPSNFVAVIDGRLTKQTPAPLPASVPLHIGLGPGFDAGINCHVVIETRRSHTLGRVYWSGTTEPDSGQPEGDTRRVLRAPIDGHVLGVKNIGEECGEGELIALIQHRVAPPTSVPQKQVGGDAGENLHDNTMKDWFANQSYTNIFSPFKGILRGLIHPSIYSPKGIKIGDVDPRGDASACFLVSDKALSIGGAVLEAILTREEIREKLWK